jgi:hypothetical protein
LELERIAENSKLITKKDAQIILERNIIVYNDFTLVKQIFSNKEVVIHYDCIRLTKLINRLYLIFDLNVVFRKQYFRIHQSVKNQKDVHCYVNSVT